MSSHDPVFVIASAYGLGPRAIDSLREKVAVSEQWIQKRMENAYAKGVSSERNQKFMDQQLAGVDRALDKMESKGITPHSSAAAADNMKKRMGAFGKSLTQEIAHPEVMPSLYQAQGMGGMHATPAPPGAVGGRAKTLMDHLPKSNMGRAALGAGALAAGYGAYRMLTRPNPQQQPQQQQQQPQPQYQQQPQQRQYPQYAQPAGQYAFRPR